MFRGIKIKLTHPIIRKNAKGMNKTETAYAQKLELLYKANEIVGWKFEPITFRLAPKTTYTPDFIVVTSEHVELHEIKGSFVRDDAMVKFKVAAEMFPYFRWEMIVGKSARGKYSWESKLVIPKREDDAK